MASDSETAFSSSPSFVETLMNSTNRDISVFLPFILGLNPHHQETQNQESPRGSRERIVLINPMTHNMAVIETDSSSILGFESLFNGKYGRRPASKASIDAMESVDVQKDDEQCVICLEDWTIGEKVKEMPCQHRFCGGCIEKWLRAHGTCPVCRYEMPVDENEDGDGKMERGAEGFGWALHIVGIERNQSEL